MSFFFARVVSRAAVIDFVQPSVAPSNEQEDVVYAKLDDLIISNKLSSSIGWAIEKGKDLMNSKDVVTQMRKKLRSIFQGRSCNNWAILLFFVKQVCTALCIIHRFIIPF